MPRVKRGIMPRTFESPDPTDTSLLYYSALPNAGKGFGYGKTERGFLTGTGILKVEGYDRSINMTVSGDGTVVSPSFAATYRLSPYVSATEHPKYPPSFLVPWETTAFIPNVIFPLYISAWKFQDGAAAVESDATTETYASAAFHDHDGTAYLYAGTFSTTTGTAQYLQRRSQAGVWASSVGSAGTATAIAGGGQLTNSSATWIVNQFVGQTVTTGSSTLVITSNTTDTLIGTGGWVGGVPSVTTYVIGEGNNTGPLAKYIISSAGALWRSTSDYQVSKCPDASNPMASASWGGAFRVGTSDSKITAIAAIGASPVVFKEDGIYFFIEADSRFERKFAASSKHPNNFAFVCPNGANGLFTTCANGDFVDVQQFGAIVVDNPLQSAMERDTPIGRIEHMATDGRYVYALTAPGAKRAQPSGMTILTTTDTTNYTSPGSFTDITSTLTDGSTTTTFDIATISTLVNGDAVLVGFDTPFLGVEFLEGTSVGTISVPPTRNLAAHISTGAGTFTAVSIFDGTATYADTYTSNFSMSSTGLVSIKPDSDISTWAPATYGTITKYWLRLSFSADFTGSITQPISEVYIVPVRAAPNFTTTNFDQSEMFEATGMNPKVLRWDRGGDQDVWDDIYTMPAVGPASRNVFRSPGSNKIAISHAPTPNSPEGSLIVATRDEFVQLPLPANTTSPVVYEPRLARDVSTGYAPVFYPSAIDFGSPHQLVWIEVYGQNLSEGTDSLQAAVRMDDTFAWYTTEKVYENYARWNVEDGDMVGSVLHSAFSLLDGAATDPIGPSINGIVFWVRPAGSNLPPRRIARTTVEVS